VLLAHFVTVRRQDRILDLGTGGGIIPLLLAGRHPEAKIRGLDHQPETVDMATRSVALNGLARRIHIDIGDYRVIKSLYDPGSFDVVTLNPPYREASRGQVSPAAERATARHELAGGLGDAVQAASVVVRFGGRVAVVFLAERLADLVVELRAQRLEPKRLRLIHARAGRPANLLLLEAVKGGGVGLAVEAPLVVYESGQTFTSEVHAIYNT
jgi:tRNA1Val (adenine37-N6)-methyltransferase